MRDSVTVKIRVRERDGEATIHPPKRADDGCYYCLVESEVLFTKPKKIFGDDAQQAEELAKELCRFFEGAI